MFKNSMKPLLCFGELLIDFLNFNSAFEGGYDLPEFRQYPGGAPANVAAAVALLGGDVRFLGQVGADRFGRFLIHAMQQVNVDTRYISIHPTAPTALAFVFLDDSGDRSFEFLREQSADVLMTPGDLPEGAFAKTGIFHFCSNTLTDSHIADTTEAAINIARAQGAVISFDVNLRHNLWRGKEAEFTVIQSFFKMADIVKLSREEADWLIERGLSRDKWLQSATAVWISDGGKRIEILSANGQQQMQPPQVSVVDTTSGGDAFTGGLLHALSVLGPESLDKLDARQIEQITGFAATCGSIAVSRTGALPALPVWDEVKEQWPF
ncbi:MAG: carbohydrate kinase family protein [Pseudomonadales bacterium]